MYIVKTLASDIHTTATFTHTAHSDIHTHSTQRHSPLQAPPVVPAALDATPGTQILPSFAVMLKPKSRFRSRFLEFTLNSSGLSIILRNSAKPRRQLFRQPKYTEATPSVFLAHANVSSIRPETVENGESKCLVGLNRKMGLVQVD